MNYEVNKKQLFATVDSVRAFRGVLYAHPITIVTDHRLLLGFMTSLLPNSMLSRWQESLSQLDTTIEYLEAMKNIIADAFSRIYNPIKIPPTRDSLSAADNRQSFTVQLPVITNHLTFPTPTFIFHYQVSPHILPCLHKQTTESLLATAPEGRMKMILNIGNYLTLTTKRMTEPGL